MGREMGRDRKGSVGDRMGLQGVGRDWKGWVRRILSVGERGRLRIRLADSVADSAASSAADLAAGSAADSEPDARRLLHSSLLLLG